MSEETASLRAMGRTKENGAADTEGAQIVITTHAMIETYAAKGLYVNQIMPLWEGATYIDDNGKTKKERLARQLWLFDESVVPYETLQLTADDLRASADVFERYEWSEPAEHTRRLAAEVATGTSQTAALPRFDWLRILSRISDLVLKYVLRPGTNETALYEASGWPVRIHRDERIGENVVLLGRYKLPGGLRHAIIADGSAGFRQHYVELETHDRRIKWLPSSNKTYRNLRVLRMDIGAGKGAYGDPAKRKALVRAVVAAFKRIPSGEPLLVVHRKQFGAELQEEVNQLARAKGIASERLRFLTWGKHASTNEFARIKNVLLVGLLQYPNKTNEGMVRANGKRDPSKPLPFAVLEEMRLGEMDHAVLQAACRGAMRKMVDGDVPEGCQLFLLASTRGHMGFVPERLEKLFPEAEVHEWAPFDRSRRDGGESRRWVVRSMFKLLGEKESCKFWLEDLVRETGLSVAQARRRLSDKEVRSMLAAHGLELKARTETKGQTRATEYMLRRGAGWPESRPAAPSRGCWGRRRPSCVRR